MHAVKVQRRAAFLVHDAHLQGVAVQPQGILHEAEQVRGQGNLLGPVHLGLHDVDRATGAVAMRPGARQVVHGAPGADGGVQQGLDDRGAVEPHDVGFEVRPDVADQHHAAAPQGHRIALGVQIGGVGAQCAGHAARALGERGRQVARA